MRLILWCRGVHRLDGLGADDFLLDRESFLHSVIGVCRGAAFLLLGNDALNTYRRLNTAGLHTIETWEHLTTCTDIDTRAKRPRHLGGRRSAREALAGPGSWEWPGVDLEPAQESDARWPQHERASS